MRTVLAAALRHSRMVLLLPLLCGCAGNRTPNPYPNNLLPLVLKQDPAAAEQIAKCQQAGAIFTLGFRDDGVLVMTIQAPPDKLKQLQNECFRDFPMPGVRASVEYRVEPAAASNH